MDTLYKERAREGLIHKRKRGKDFFVNALVAEDSNPCNLVNDPLRGALMVIRWGLLTKLSKLISDV